VRLYTGDDGHSHFEDIFIPFISQGDIGSLSKKYEATGIIFRETPSDYHFVWHNAPCRQYIVMLDNSVEIEIHDGTKRVIGMGEILLAEDTTGSGHVSRSINDRPRKSVFITLPL